MIVVVEVKKGWERKLRKLCKEGELVWGGRSGSKKRRWGLNNVRVDDPEAAQSKLLHPPPIQHSSCARTSEQGYIFAV